MLKTFKKWHNLYSPSQLIFNASMLYPTPATLTYTWNFGFLAGIMLVSQIVTGLFLVFWYIPDIDVAFTSVNYIVNEVTCGWLIKSLHANGASFFFVAVYLHIMRNLMQASYATPREKVWLSGVVLLILLILTAFLGYILPWGQMSYWAATVITSLLSTIPYIGDHLLIFLWGGLTIGQPTLTRIFGLHFLLPFVIGLLTFLHLVLLHKVGSGTPTGAAAQTHTKISFHPYFTVKDTVGALVLSVAYFVLVSYAPDLLGHTDNYIAANPAVTPLHIVPEWYFLPFYGILRSVPSKLGGVLLLIAAIACLFALPVLASNTVLRNTTPRPFHLLITTLFFLNFILLGFAGAQPIEEPFYTICQLATIYYFVFFFVLVPVSNLIDRRWARRVEPETTKPMR